MAGNGLAVVILTYNEEKHLARCIDSVAQIAKHVMVVDSYSTDNTKAIAERYGAAFIQNSFINQAQQFNFALTKVPPGFAWVLRLDADEYLTSELIDSVASAIDSDHSIKGYRLKRRMTFGGRLIRFGGVFPVEVIRLFRPEAGRCEERWMDEHIEVTGKVEDLSGELIDDNLNSLTWWVNKHNQYSNREAVEILMLRHRISQASSARLGGQAGFKRLLKEGLYARLPVLPKVLAYFLYRYLFRLGFLDGKQGFAFHFLQGFWYRYLVEAKVMEVERYIASTGDTLDQAAAKILGINTKGF
jgi:glycosyltransferase involved in cell wall biosynthesis